MIDGTRRVKDTVTAEALLDLQELLKDTLSSDGPWWAQNKEEIIDVLYQLYVAGEENGDQDGYDRGYDDGLTEGREE